MDLDDQELEATQQLFNNKEIRVNKNMEEDIKQCKDLIRILDRTSRSGKSKHTDCIRHLIARNKEMEQNYINPSKARFTYFDNGKGTKVVIEGFIPKSKVKEKIENKKEDAERYIFGVDVEEGQAMYKILDELEQELLED